MEEGLMEMGKEKISKPLREGRGERGRLKTEN